MSLTIDASRGVVLDAEVNVLRYAETKATGLGEVALDKLVLFNLQARLLLAWIVQMDDRRLG